MIFDTIPDKNVSILTSFAKGGKVTDYLLDAKYWYSDTWGTTQEDVIEHQTNWLWQLNKPSAHADGESEIQTYVLNSQNKSQSKSYYLSGRFISLNARYFPRPKLNDPLDISSILSFPRNKLSSDNIYNVRPKKACPKKLRGTTQNYRKDGTSDGCVMFPLLPLKVNKVGRKYESTGTTYSEAKKHLGFPSADEVFAPDIPFWQPTSRSNKVSTFTKVPQTKKVYGVKDGKAILLGHANKSTALDFQFTWYAKSIEYVAQKIASPLVVIKEWSNDWVTIDSFTGNVGGLPTYPLDNISSAMRKGDALQSIAQGLWGFICYRMLQETDIKVKIYDLLEKYTPMNFTTADVINYYIKYLIPEDTKDSWKENYGTNILYNEVALDSLITAPPLKYARYRYDSPEFIIDGSWDEGGFALFSRFHDINNEDYRELFPDYKYLVANNGSPGDLDSKPILNPTYFLDGVSPSGQPVVKLSMDDYLALNDLIDTRLKDKAFLDKCVEFYNDRTIESVNNTNLMGFLSPSFYIDTNAPDTSIKLTPKDKDLKAFKENPNKEEIKRIQTLMGIIDYDLQAKKELSEQIRMLEDNIEIELNLKGKEHFNLKSAFNNFFKTASKKYVGRIGKQTEALAPDGERSTLTTKQYDLVRTREFMTWFGDWEEAYESKNYNGVSKCISDDGEPKVVYHGTVSPFEWTKFNLGEDSSWTQDAPPVVYFAESLSYSEWFGSGKETGKAGDDYVYEFFLNCRNPINLIDFGRDDLNIFDLEFLLKERHGIEIDTTEIVKRVPNIQAIKYPFWVFLRNYTRFGLGNMFDKFIALGYDSIKFIEDNPSNLIDGKKDITIAWVIFNKNQAKLGDGRNTTFSQFSDDFRFKKGGNVNR